MQDPRQFDETFELRLFNLKWYPYRFHTPEVANLFCLYEYISNLQDYLEAIGESRNLNTLKSFDISDPKKFKMYGTLNKLRQFIDKHGLPYNVYWNSAFQAFNKMKFKRYYLNTFLNENLKQETISIAKQRMLDYIQFSNHPKLNLNKATNEVQKNYHYYIISRFQEKYGESWKGKLVDAVRNRLVSVTILERI